MSTHRTHEWQDSMADRAATNPPARPLVMPQGRPEQGWPARRYSPEAQPHVIDRLREDFDDQSESADEQVLFWLLKGLIVVCTTLLCAWVIAGGLNA